MDTYSYDNKKIVNIKRKCFLDISPISFEIVPFLDKRGEEKQMIKIGNFDYVKLFLGEIDTTDFFWPNKVFIAKKERRIMGWITYQIKNDEMINLKIAVDYENAEKGVSKALVQRCIILAKDSNLTSISTKVLSSNILSQGLFRSMGFELKKSRNPVFNGYDAVFKL